MMIDELIARVRAEAERPEYQVTDDFGLAVSMAADADGKAAASGNSGGSDTLKSCSDPDFDALLLIPNREHFVAAAYEAILRRPVDEDGLEHFVGKLCEGFGQPFVLAALRASSEGRAAAAPLPGFGLAPALHRFWQLSMKLRCGRLGKLANQVYHAWRHFKLAISGRLLTHLSSRDERVLATLSAALDGSIQRSAALELKLTEEMKLAHQAQAAAAKSAQDSLATRWADWQHQQTLRIDQLQQDTTVLRASLKTLRFSVEQSQHSALANTTALATAGVQPSAGSTPATTEAALMARIERYYLAFEEAHRGSEADIRQQQQRYLLALATLPSALLTLPVLDLGCGRGEWLRLLAEHGYRARGVELNPVMAAAAQAHGLEVEVDDALTALQRLPAASVAAVSAFHLVEHLPFELLFALLEQIGRVLAPGGLIMLETPNPENVLVGSHTFYHDFSHRNPVTPTSLDFLLAYLGFDERELLRFNPYPSSARLPEDSPTAARLNGHFCGPQDYALIARQPGATAEGKTGAEA